MPLDYWRDHAQRFYLSYSPDRLYYLRTEDDEYSSTIDKASMIKLYRTLGNILFEDEVKE